MPPKLPFQYENLNTHSRISIEIPKNINVITPQKAITGISLIYFFIIINTHFIDNYKFSKVENYILLFYYKSTPPLNEDKLDYTRVFFEHKLKTYY